VPPVSAPVIPAVRSASANTAVDIRPSGGWFDLELGGIWRHRELLYFMVWRDITVRYKQALLGAGWAVIQPVFAVVVFTVVFGRFAKIPSEGLPYPVFAFAATLPWTYFAEAIRRSGIGLVSDAELIKKIYFPRLIIPLAAVIAPLVDTGLAFVVFLGLLTWYKVAFTWHMLFLPVFFLVAMLMALAIGLWIGPLNVRFRDVMYVLPFLTQVWMYASPIVYPSSLVPAKWRMLYNLNPMVGVIDGFRWALLAKAAPTVTGIAVSLLLILLLLFGGLVYFKRAERSFADII
jgi:lipopolysaccharide transport system permease protein